MKQLANLSRILVGIVFTLSGFVKGIDPLGSAYKFTDYFYAFGWSGLSKMALFCAFALAAIEFCCGVFLLLNLFTRRVAGVVLFFMAIFTPLTLYLAIANPVADCGCFGDAFILSNWATFGKNIVLLLFTLVLFSYRKKFNNTCISCTVKRGLVIGISSLFIAFEYYNYAYLPIIDFRPYKIGANLRTGDNEQLEEVVRLLYKNKKTGDIKQFDEDNYPWQDSLNWEFVDTRIEFAKPETKLRQINFFADSYEYGEVSRLVTHETGYVALVIIREPEPMSKQLRSRLQDVVDYTATNKWAAYVLTAAPSEDIIPYLSEAGIDLPFGVMDEIELKTMIRDNIGLILIKDGIIFAKWSSADIPTTEKLQEEGTIGKQLMEKQRELTTYRIISVILCIILLSLMYLCLSKTYRRKN